MAFVKTIVRVGVVSGLAAGALVVIAGPHRVGAVMSQVRSHVNDLADSVIDDPIALRAQLRDLQREYPTKIAQITSELDTLNGQIGDLERERRITARAHTLAQAKASEWTDMLSRAKDAQGNYRTVAFQYDNQTFNFEQAVARASAVRGQVTLFATRVEDMDRDLTFLVQQRTRLDDLLKQLETEQDQLHMQIAQLDSEIDMIERNETLITMIEEREAAISEYSSGSKGVSIAQVEKRLAKIHAEQEARFNAITGRTKNSSFLDQAEQELMHEDAVEDLEKEFSFEVKAPTPQSVTIITPEGERESTSAYVMN